MSKKSVLIAAQLAVLNAACGGGSLMDVLYLLRMHFLVVLADQ